MRATNQTFTTGNLGLALWALRLPAVVNNNDCDLIGPGYGAQLRHEVFLVLKFATEINLHQTI
jgi:hypothetical protein